MKDDKEIEKILLNDEEYENFVNYVQLLDSCT